ncbi:MAG: hypothetical protein EOO38_19125 [Cytophagaceae bacterium]|nr:MAG: hypothetical protein EOO38_19125 [Cytophagaceae bacterium]
MKLIAVRELKIDIPKEARILAERMLKDLENSKRPVLEAVKTSLDNSFYNSIKELLNPEGIMVVQSTSPYVAPKSFWTVNKTLESAGLHTVPYHNYVPSFGDWGYIMAMPNQDHNWFSNVPSNLKFLNALTLQQMFIFPEDMKAHQLIRLEDCIFAGHSLGEFSDARMMERNKVRVYRLS